jgi:hypothetical protein
VVPLPHSLSARKQSEERTRRNPRKHGLIQAGIAAPASGLAYNWPPMPKQARGKAFVPGR